MSLCLTYRMCTSFPTSSTLMSVSLQAITTINTCESSSNNNNNNNMSSTQTLCRHQRQHHSSTKLIRARPEHVLAVLVVVVRVPDGDDFLVGANSEHGATHILRRLKLTDGTPG